MFAALLALPAAIHAQVPTADAADVGTIADIVRVSYEVISGAAGTPRQWRRDSTLYMPGATFVAVDETDGRVQATIMTPEEYRQSAGPRPTAIGMLETEIGRRIERWCNVAQVRSVAVVRQTPDGAIQACYVNYFQLYWDGRAGGSPAWYGTRSARALRYRRRG